MFPSEFQCTPVDTHNLQDERNSARRNQLRYPIETLLDWNQHLKYFSLRFNVVDLCILFADLSMPTEPFYVWHPFILLFIKHKVESYWLGAPLLRFLLHLAGFAIFCSSIALQLRFEKFGLLARVNKTVTYADFRYYYGIMTIIHAHTINTNSLTESSATWVTFNKTNALLPHELALF